MAVAARPMARVSWWSRCQLAAPLLAVAMLLALGTQLAAAMVEEEGIPVAATVDLASPRAKISSAIRAFIDVPVPPQGIDARLRSLTVPASRPDLLRVRLDVPVTPATTAAVAATGARILSTAARWNAVLVEATMAQIDALALLPDVRLIAPALRPHTHGQSVTAQPGNYTDPADTVIHTDQVRSTYQTAGAGMTVGIISDSINASSTVGAGSVAGSAPGTLTGTNPQANGNLPASIMVCNIGDVGGSTDEGEAMMEEAYHLASGAAFAFAPCGSADTDMASNIGLLKTQAGCAIICDDISYLDEPFFQDGPIAQAASEFVQGGGIYLTAAGNNANTCALATYMPVVSTTGGHNAKGAPNGNSFHNWGVNGSTAPGYLPLVVQGGATIEVILQWNQPFQSWGLGSGSASDFNLWLYKTASTTSSITSSTTVQGTAAAPSGDPFEIIQYKNGGSSNATVYLAVDYFGGVSTAQVMRVLVFTDGYSVTSPGNTVLSFGTSMGHATTSNVLAIAAMDYSASPYAVEPFSSLGGWGSTGIPYYYSTTGQLLSGAPQRRNKPDITAPDGVSVWNANFQPFYGTSGATPHAAAAAALSWAVQPTFTNLQIIAALQASATDITTAPASTGPDPWSGYGLVNAFASIGTTLTSVSSVTTSSANGTYYTGTIPILVTFTNPVTVSGTPVLQLNTTPSASATYASGSGSATLTFNYLIQQGQMSAALDVASTAALSGGSLASGSIPVSLTLPSPGSRGSLSANASIQIDGKGTQTITFSAIANQIYGATLPLSASASSGLAPAFSIVSGPATLNNAMLTCTGLGTVIVAADQAGNASWLAAPEVRQQFTVTAAPDTIILPATTTVVYSASPSSVMPTITGPSSPVASVSYQPYSGNPAAGGSATGSATATPPTDVGWYRVTASLDANHGGGSASGSLDITPALLTVTAVSKTITVGSAPGPLSATMATFLGSDTAAVVSGSAALSTTASATSPAGVYPITVSVAGLSAANYTFQGVNGTITIGLVSQTISFANPGAPSAGSDQVALVATATSGLGVSFSVLSGPATVQASQLTFTGAGTVVVAANQAGNSVYQPAPEVTQTIVLTQQSAGSAAAPAAAAGGGGGGGSCGLGSGVSALALTLFVLLRLLPVRLRPR